MRTLVLTGLAILAMSAAGCRKHDIRTAAIYVPGLKHPSCAKFIVASLAREQAIPVKDIEVRMETKTIYVRYNSLQRSVKNLEFAIANVGFDANEVPANDEAREKLPDGCR